MYIIVTYIIGQNFGGSLNLPGAQEGCGAIQVLTDSRPHLEMFPVIAQHWAKNNQGVSLLSRVGPMSPAPPLHSEFPDQSGF